MDRRGEVRGALAAEFALTPEDLAQMMPSDRQVTFGNRVAWAYSYLKQAGQTSSPRRGAYEKTEHGRRPGHRRDHQRGSARPGHHLSPGEAVARHDRPAGDPAFRRRPPGPAGEEGRFHHDVVVLGRRPGLRRRPAETTIVLVDGQTLAQLMMDAGVGVSEMIRLLRADEDYFDGL